MTRVGAQFIVEVDSIAARSDVLGQVITVDRSPKRWQITLPTAPDCWNFPATRIVPPASSTPDPRDYQPTTALLRSAGDLVELRLVLVTVTTDSALTVATFDRDTQAAEHDRLVYELWEDAIAMVKELCERLKLEIGQYWIEPSGRFPRVVNSVSLIDFEANLTFGTQLGKGWGSFRVVAPETVLSIESMGRVEASFRRGPVEADELLLNEAKYLLDSEQAVAFDRSTLIAAVAVELRTKRLLRTLSAPDDAMLDLLIDNPRDWSMSAHGLFLKAIPVVLGRDLGDSHRSLAKRVQVLFNHRNGIAHKGVQIDKVTATRHVQTASDAFAHMASLEPIEESPSESHASAPDR